MALDARTSEEQLTPETRRTMLRAFGDRMLLKLGNMDDPEDLAGIERAVRVAAVIERIYSRCDRAEGHAPDPNKLEAERARHMKDAIQARFELATSLEWNEKNQQRMGNWLDAAETAVKATVPAPVAAPAPAQPVSPVLPGVPQAPQPATTGRSSEVVKAGAHPAVASAPSADKPASTDTTTADVARKAPARPEPDNPPDGSKVDEAWHKAWLARDAAGGRDPPRVTRLG